MKLKLALVEFLGKEALILKAIDRAFTKGSKQRSNIAL